MKHSLTLFICLLFSGCVHPHSGWEKSQAEAAERNELLSSVNRTPKLPSKKVATVGPSGVRVQTPSEKEAARLATRKYLLALHASIRELDDMSTSPDVIARAAVGANLDLLRSKMRAKTIQFEEYALGRDSMARALARAPTQSDIDLAVYSVLKIRQQRREQH